MSIKGLSLIEKMMTELVETSNKVFKSLRARGCISEKNLIFPMSFRKAVI